MARKYKRKTSRQQWTVEQLNDAAEAVQRGTSIRKAALSFGLPRSTLGEHISAPKLPKPLGSINTVFNKVQEQELSDHLLQMENRFYGITRNDVKALAFELAEKNNLPHPFNRTKQTAGRDWLNWLQRNPHISFR